MLNITCFKGAKIKPLKGLDFFRLFKDSLNVSLIGESYLIKDIALSVSLIILPLNGQQPFFSQVYSLNINQNYAI